MENMIFILAAIITFSLFAFCVGVLMLLFKKRRAKGKRIALISFSSLVIAILLGASLGSEVDSENAAIDQKNEQSKEQKEVAAEPVKPELKKHPYAQKTKNMAGQIVGIFKKTYKVAAQPEIPNTPLCREDGYCAIKIENIIIRIFGAGLVDVQTPEPKYLTTYREVCSAVYSAISGEDLDYSAVLLDKSFQRASVTGSFKHVLNNVEIKVIPDSGGILGCSFFKYGR